MANDGAVTIIGNQNATVTDGNNSLIIAGNGNDTLTAGSESIVVAGNGNDKVTVGADSAIVAGNGSDTLTAGADSTIIAGNGNDTITMGASDTAVVGNGKDTFVLQPSGAVTLTAPASVSVNEDGSIALAINAGSTGFGFGDDAIFGFNASKDKIQFSTSQFANFAAVMAAAKQVGDDTVITGDGTDTIYLDDVQRSSLTASDFVFVNSSNVTVTISGIPAGVSLSDAAGPLTITNGSITLTQAQLAGLTLKAGEVTAGTLTVKATDATTGNSITKIIALSVNPVAPTLSGPTSLTVNAGGTVALGITETPFDPRDTVSLTITGVPADASLSAGTRNNNGSWTLSPAQLSGLTLKAGQTAVSTLTVTATNTLGSTASTTQSIQLNIVTPLTITFDSVSFVDTGVQGDHITNNGSVTLSGTVTDNVTVSQLQVFNGGTLLGLATVNNTAHTWSLTVNLTQGTYNQLKATATDSGGNTASASTTQFVIVDTTPPALTSQTESVSGLTRSTSDTITVTATDADGVASVAIWDDATNTQIGNAALSNGAWSLTASNLSNGNHNFYAVVTDDAGNTTPTTDLATVTVDTTPPSVTSQTESVSGLTRSTSDTITVTATDANGVASVVIWDDATHTQVGNATTSGNGVWSRTASNLSDGNHNFYAVVTDNAGNTTPTTDLTTVTVDTTPPSITFDTVSFVDTGAPNATNIGAVYLAGTTSDNDTVAQVEVFNGTQLLGIAAVDNSAHTWSLTTILPQGLYSAFNATATDEVGNVATATTAQSVQVDTTPPSITFDTVSFVDTGVPGDPITDNGSVTLSGTTSDDVTVAQVQVFNGGTLLGTAAVDNVAHTWSLATTLAQGTYNNLSAVATDEAGNAATATTTQSVQIDTTPPSITFDSVSFSDTGIQGDHITDNGSVTLSGTTSDNVTVSQVQVFNGGTLLGTATVDSVHNTWSLATTLVQGTYNNLNAVATDEAGNAATATTTQSVQIDTTPPSITFDNVSFDVSSNATSQVSADGVVTLSGTTSDNVTVSQVQVFNGTQSLGTATVDNTGHWTLKTVLAQGTYNQLSATATDEAGNSATKTTPQSVQVDTTAPTISFDTVSLTDAADPSGSASTDGVATMSGRVSDNVSVSQVQIFNGSQLLGTATLDGDGDWSLATTLAQGSYNQLHATATDEAGNTSDATTKRVVTVSPETGNVIDGYISGATVFADVNHDGTLDAGDASGTTDKYGHFVLGPGSTQGPLVLIGGVDTATNLPFTGMLTAPTGSTQVTPLTTLVQSVAAANGGNVAAASQAVASALGINPSVDLTSLDTVAAAYSGNSQAFVAASSILNTVTMVASAVAGTGATNFSAAASSAFSAIATQIANLPANTTLDLTSSSVVASTLTSVATATSAPLSPDQTNGIVSVVTSVNTATNQAASGNLTPAALLTNVSAASIVAQGSASAQLSQATAGTALLSTVVANNEGTNLTDSVTSATHAVGSIAPTPPQVLGLTPTDSSPNNTTLVHYTLTFSDPVTGVDASDFSLVTNGVSGATIASVTPVSGSGGTQYTIAVNTGSGDGTLALSFTGTSVQDLAGNLLKDKATHTGAAYTVDPDTGEQAALSLNVTDTLINAAGAATVHFAVGGLESDDNGTVTFSDGLHQVLVNVTGAQSAYAADLSALNDGSITTLLSLNNDAAGNAFVPVAGNAVVLDRDTQEQNIASINAAGTGIVGGTGDLKAQASVTLTVNLNEPLTIDPTGGLPTLTLNDGGTATYAGPPKSTILSALTFTYIVQSGENTADLAVSALYLNGATATDAAGNNADLSIAANLAGALQIDTTPPSAISITQADPASTNAGVVHYTVTFSEAVTGVTASQFSLVVTGINGAAIAGVTPVSGSNGKQYTVAVSTGSGTGTIALNLNGAGIFDLAGNTLAGGGATTGADYNVSTPTAVLWSSSTYPSQATAGDHLYGPAINSYSGVYNLYYGETPSNFNVNGPDAITQHLTSFDPFFLPYRAGNQVVANYNVTAFPFTYSEILPVTLVGNTTARQFEPIGVYISQDQNGTPTIDRVIGTAPLAINPSFTIGTPTAIEALPAGTQVHFDVLSYVNTNATSGVMSSYEVVWDQYNPQAQTYQVYTQVFHADNSTWSPVVSLVSETGVSSYTAAHAWFFRAASGYVSQYAMLSATHNSANNTDVLNFQGYFNNGTTSSENFQLAPDLSHYAPGATNAIVQNIVNPPTRTGTLFSVLFAPDATGAAGGYSAAWDETVTDSNGLHNQVEFAMFNANSTGVTGSLIKQATFQVADGLPQQIRVGTFSYLGQSYEVLAYGDTISSHIVEYDSNGNQIASYSEATNQFFNQLEIFGDGRVGLSYDNVLDGSGTSQFKTDIIDLRTSGIPSNFGGLVNVSTRTFAGTQFNDNVVGVNNANNTYYYVGRNTTGQGPSDTFTGTLNNGTLTSWNTAIFADARSNYSITTVNGVTTITNTGDPAHAGTLVTTNVQELAFAPGVDPSPQSDGSIIVDGTVVILGAAAGNRPFTIDPGATLELDSATPQVVTLAGGTFGVTGPGTVTSANGDAIDFTASGGSNASLASAGAVTGAANGINAIQNGVGDITVGPVGGVVGQAGDGVIAEQSATGTGNIFVNAGGSLTGTGTGSIGLFAENLNAANNGNITITQTGGASGGQHGIRAVTQGNGNISIESGGAVTGGVQFGIRAESYGTGSISGTTDPGSTINSGGAGVSLVNLDTAIAASANSMITLTANGTVNSGTTLNPSGSVPQGLAAGYFGANGTANTNINGTVVINNNANITAAAGYGIDAFNWGNGDATMNDGAGTSVSGAQYGVAAFGLSHGTGNVAVNVGANATITGSSIFAIQAFDNDVGSVSVTTSTTGDIFNSGSSGINAQSQATSASASSSVTVIANGTIHSGSLLTPNGSAPAGIAAGYSPNGTNQTTNNVAGNVLVQSNATIVAAAGAGINAYNFGTGNVTVTTGLTSSITAPANGIQANALNGGNVSVTNAGSVTGGTGLFAGANHAGNITVENDGQITGTSFAGINIAQNSAGSTGSTTITNTGTVVGAPGHSSINVSENSAGTVRINNSGTIGPSVVTSSTQAIFENGGTAIINNNGQIDGSINTSNTGAFTGTMNNNAGATWQAGFIDDEGSITASGTGSAITIVGASNGINVANTGTGNLTVEGGAALTANSLNIGQLAGSHGTVLVTGAGTTVNTTAGQYQNILVGNDGTASLTIASQAVVTTTNMEVANNFDVGVTDTLNVNGGTLNANQGLTIANAGTAVATVENAGTINTGFVNIASQAGSTGSLTVTGVGSVVTASNFVGVGSSQSSGTLSVGGGGAVVSDGGIGDEGTITVSGAGSAITIVGASNGINAGYSGHGNLTVEAGATLTSDFLNIAQLAGSTGTVDITGAGTTVNTTAGQYQNIAVGFDGTASLTIADQAVVTTTNMGVGNNFDAGITDTLDVNGGTLNANQGLTIANAGTANATVENGGTINTGFLSIASQAGSAGSLTVTGAGSLVQTSGLNLGSSQSSATLTVNNGGAVDIGSGTTTVANAVHVGNFASIQGAGTINGNVVDDGTVTATGLLEITGAVSGTMGSLVIDGGATLRLDGADSQGVTFAGSPATLVLEQPGSLAGPLSGLVGGDVIDLVNTQATSASIVGSTLTVNLASGPALTYQINGPVSGGGFAVQSDGANGTDLVMAPGGEAPSLAGTVTSLTVNEGGLTIGLPITVTPQDADDTVSITVTGLPADATLSAGTNNGGGSWTLTPAQLANLQITTGEDTTATLVVTATNSDGGSASQQIALTVSPVPEAPNFTGQFVTLNEGATIALPITMTPVDSDDVVAITVTSLPSDAKLSAGTKNTDGSWSLTAAQFAGVQLTAGEGTTSTITVTAVNAEGGSNSLSETLTVNSVAEAPTVSAPSTLTVTDGGSVLLNINVAAADADDALGFVTISGVPTDATLSAGNNGGGTWTLTPAQLAGLTLTAGPHSSSAAQTLGNVQLTVTATATDPGTLAVTSVPQTINLTIQPMLWSSSLFPAQTVPGTHTYGAANAVNGNLVAQISGVTTSGYSNAGPDTVTQQLLTLDPFLLPYQSGSQVLATTTFSTFSAIGRQMLLPTLNSAGTSIEGLGFYVSEDQTGTATINRATFSSGTTGLNSAVPSITSTAMETGLIGQDLAFFTSFTNGSTGIFSGTGATYSVAWAQYNSATQNYSIDFQLFNPNNTAASAATLILSMAGVSSATAAPAWAFRSAGSNSSGTIIDASAIAMLNGSTGLNYIQFQAYNASNGVAVGPAFQIQPVLTAYAAGATNQITQEPDSPDHTYGAIGLQFTPNSTPGSGYSFAWNETVTDSNGTHDQVEFAIFKNGSVFSQSTFQIADGLAQNIRLLTANISGTFVTLMSYGDANGTNVVEFNQATGAKMASLFDPTSATYTQMTSFNDGRIMLQSDVPVDANGTTQYSTNIYDLRTSGLVVNNATANDGKDKYYAGTQYNDAVIGENGVNNTYYFVGQNTNTVGPTDSFTGGTGTGWNVAILPDAMSDYTVTTLNGVTTLVNTGDPAHAGTLNVSNVQALAFAPTIDPSGNAGSLEVTGDALDILGPLPGGGEPITIDNGSKLELGIADNGTVTFAGGTGTLKIDTASSFTGTIGGQLAIGDVIDFADITTGANATIGYSGNNSPGTLTVSDGTHTASIALLGNYSLGNFTASSDGHGGTSVVDPPIDAAAAQGVALLRNYMASSFVAPGATDTGGSTTVPTPDQAAMIAPALHSHGAAA
jgi:T5SS/PEP-CTERM-associated repeat protein